jgi:hypothetical protein
MANTTDQISPFGPLATATPVTPALPSISIVPLPVKEELVVSAVLRVVSSVRRAVYAVETPLNVFELSFDLDLLLTLDLQVLLLLWC